jgi:hypothetical protein
MIYHYFYITIWEKSYANCFVLRSWYAVIKLNIWPRHRSKRSITYFHRNLLIITISWNHKWKGANRQTMIYETLRTKNRGRTQFLQKVACSCFNSDTHYVTFVKHSVVDNELGKSRLWLRQRYWNMSVIISDTNILQRLTKLCWLPWNIENEVYHISIWISWFNSFIVSRNPLKNK